MNKQGYAGGSAFNYSPRNGVSPPDLTEEDLDDLRIELSKVEDEIQTLRQVLLAKEKHAMSIKSQLGVTPLGHIRQNLSKGWQDVQTSAPYMTASMTLDDISQSNAYKRTQETFSYAGQVTSAALSSVGMAITRRLADMRALPLPSPPRPLGHNISVPAMRHSSTFRSFEEVVGSVKGKMTGGGSNEGNTSGFEKQASRRNSREGPF